MFVVQVMCRFRPLNPSEKDRGDDFLPKFPSLEQVTFGRPVSFSAFHTEIFVIVFG